MMVDSTRKGKRFPDSMSKTIPIWTCVLNRAIMNYRKRIDGHDLVDNVSVNVPEISLHFVIYLTSFCCSFDGGFELNMLSSGFFLS